MTDLADKASRQGPQARGAFDDMARTLLGAFFLALIIRMVAFEPFNIPSGSMIPNLLVGDYLFVSKYSYGYSSLSTVLGLVPVKGRLFPDMPKRGDVVVFKLPSDNRTDYIKRVVGLPGDNIQVKNGLLHINGTPVSRERLDVQAARDYLEPYRGSDDYIETFPEGAAHIIREDSDDKRYDNTGIYTVPAGHFFMMGDNRDNSMDSRTSMVSFVPFDNLVGRAEVIFFSMEDTVRFWEIWKWPTGVRWGRLMTKIR